MTGARNAGPMLALSFSGKNAVMIDQVADGYWVFCEGPGYDGEHEQYFAWFDGANQGDHVATTRCLARTPKHTRPVGRIERGSADQPTSGRCLRIQTIHRATAGAERSFRGT
jgi:hypothetical protein